MEIFSNSRRAQKISFVFNDLNVSKQNFLIIRVEITSSRCLEVEIGDDLTNVAAYTFLHNDCVYDCAQCQIVLTEYKSHAVLFKFQ